MKMTIFALALLLAGGSLAQSAPPGLTQEDMGKLMQQAQQMQACMSGIKPETIQRMQEESVGAEARIKSLCLEGKPEEAQEYAMKFGEEMQKSEDMKALKKCGDQAAAMMQAAPMQKMMQKEKIGHICDGYR